MEKKESGKKTRNREERRNGIRRRGMKGSNIL
jgi:hypothetical protein